MPLVMTTYHELLFCSGCGCALSLRLYIFKASYDLRDLMTVTLAIYIVYMYFYVYTT